MKLSRYARTRQSGRTVVVFHELHPEPLYLDIGQWSVNPDDLSDDIRRRMWELRLIIDREEIDAEELRTVETALRRRLDTPEILYLVLAEGCNFDCAYCPVQHVSKGGRAALQMSPVTVTNAIDAWLDQIERVDSQGIPFSIIFYGGEPLLNRVTLRVGLERLAELREKDRLPDDCSVLLTTNGYLLDDDDITLLRYHDVTVVVGCDGPAEIHDEYRREAGTAPTFQQVHTAISRLVSSGVRTCASAALTPSALRRLPEYDDFFHSLGVEKYGLNLLRGRRLDQVLHGSDRERYFRAASQQIADNYAVSGNPGFEYQAERRHRAFHEQRYFPTDCNGYGNQLVVHADGTAGNCPFLPGQYGDVESLDAQFELNRQQEAVQWRRRLPLYNPRCSSCDAKSICGGGCAWNAQELSGDAEAIDEGMCQTTLAMFDLLLWQQADAGPPTPFSATRSVLSATVIDDPKAL